VDASGDERLREAWNLLARDAGDVLEGRRILAESMIETAKKAQTRAIALETISQVAEGKF